VKFLGATTEQPKWNCRDRDARVGGCLPQWERTCTITQCDRTFSFRTWERSHPMCDANERSQLEVVGQVQIRTASDVGALVRHTRRQQGMSQEELAALAGVTRRWVSALESGKARAELALVLATLDALGLVLITEDASTGSAIDLDAVLARMDEN
jgi:y4mF family transcriptional regulator